VIIDVHAHFSPRAYMGLLAKRGTRFGLGLPLPHTRDVPSYNSDSPEDVAGRLGAMDEAGVEMQVLSHSIASPYSDDEAAAAEAARSWNDSAAALTKQHPDRFAMFTALPLMHVEASLTEMRRALDDLGAVGVAMNCSALNRSVTNEAMAPLYEEMDRRGTMLYFHPAGNGMCSSLIQDYKFDFAVGAPTEDTQLVAQLIADQIPARYPNIKIIVSHFGGGLAVLLQRMDHELPYLNLPELPSATARRLYYDTVGHGSQAALLAAWKAFGASQLLPGSDYPVLLAFESYFDTFDYIRHSDLPAADITKILETNAADLLRHAKQTAR